MGHGMSVNFTRDVVTAKGKRLTSMAAFGTKDSGGKMSQSTIFNKAWIHYSIGATC